MAELPRSMERDASGGGVDRVLRASGIIKEYPGAVATRVLHGVDLEIRRGEFAALMGPSGSGKSTFLNIIGLLDRPTEGTVHICGTDTSGLDDDGLAGIRARSLGFIFQFHHLLPAFTAEENVAMPMAAAHGRMTDEMRARAGVLLEAVGLGDRRKSMATRLSGGQQQRVAIARALVMEPPLVLADEPTGNLDTESAGHVFELLRQFNEERGTTFLIVTHDPRLAERCDRLIELVDGRKVRDGPLREGPGSSGR